MKFRALLEQNGKTATGLEVPEAVVEGLGGGRRAAVVVRINGHSYRSSIAVMGGRVLVGVSAENRAAADVSAGDLLDVDLTLDTAPREVSVPDDLAKALSKAPLAKKAFDALTYSNKRRYVMAIDAAKTAETRDRRIAKTVTELGGRPRRSPGVSERPLRSSRGADHRASEPAPVRDR